MSPHDPLLALVLAVPMGVGGFVGAKVAMVLLAVVTAVLTLWLAVGRFGVPLPLATVGTALAFASPPLAVYAQQVYPELPAALAVLVAVGALTGSLGRRGLLVLATAVVALPWLGVKYAPVAAVLALLGLVRLLRGGRRREAVAVVGGLAAAGLVYLAVHRLVWGGWTVYASGDHFAETGELSVVGTSPDYVGRSLRLVGLLVDRGFGLAAWQPAYLLLAPALAALVRLRVRRLEVVLWPLVVAWLVATYVALTMHGFWWPGRQVVVVLPLAVLAVLAWLARSGDRLRRLAAGLAAAGAVTMLVLLVDGWARELTWVVGFEGVDDPLYAARAWLLPDYRAAGPGLWLRHGAWVAVAVALVLAGWRSAVRPGLGPRDHDPLAERRQHERTS